jgi:hypothetical protein
MEVDVLVRDSVNRALERVPLSAQGFVEPDRVVLAKEIKDSIVDSPRSVRLD